MSTFSNGHRIPGFLRPIDEKSHRHVYFIRINDLNQYLKYNKLILNICVFFTKFMYI